MLNPCFACGLICVPCEVAPGRHRLPVFGKPELVELDIVVFLEQVVNLLSPGGCVVNRIEQVAKHREDGECLSVGCLEAIPIPGNHGSYAPGPVPDA